MTAYELYQQARLTEAIEAALQSVKSAPTDIDGRVLLCDLLCLDNQLERADRQLDVAAQQDSGLAPGIGLYRQLIRAAVARRDVFEAGRVPELMEDVSEVLRLHLRASIALREGALGEAGDLLRQAEQMRTPVRGECDGQPFQDLRDVDDVTAPFLEVLTSTGKYYWVGWERIEQLEFKPPRFLRDLLWRQVEMVIRGGPEALVYVPVLYFGSHRSQDAEIRLGRKTDWQETPDGPTIGVGQRILLVGDGDRPILSLGRLSFAPVDAPSAPAGNV
jgi:type VI secretion system protein ImpE